MLAPCTTLLLFIYLSILVVSSSGYIKNRRREIKNSDNSRDLGGREGLRRSDQDLRIKRSFDTSISFFQHERADDHNTSVTGYASVLQISKSSKEKVNQSSDDVSTDPPNTSIPHEFYDSVPYHPGIEGSDHEDHDDGDSLKDLDPEKQLFPMDPNIYAPESGDVLASELKCLVRPWYLDVSPSSPYPRRRKNESFLMNSTMLSPEFGPLINVSDLGDWDAIQTLEFQDVNRDAEAYASAISASSYPPTLDRPTPQVGMEACEMYESRSCCSAEQADELMLPVRSHSGIRWDLCGSPRKECNQVMAELECFYECSPFVSSWHRGDSAESDIIDSLQKIKEVPICASFCEAWYNSCRSEKTCAKDGDWIHGHQMIRNESRCLSGAHCLKFSEMYRNPQDLCNKLWGARYKYEDDNTKCFDPRAAHEHEKVWKLLKSSSMSITNFDAIVYYPYLLFLLLLYI